MTTKSKNNAKIRRRYYNNAVLLTDFNCGIANSQVEMRFQNVFRYTAGHLEESKNFPKEVRFSSWTKSGKPEEPPYVMSIHNVPFGNIDYAAYALYSCYRALGRSTRPNLFIHVVDPGVGSGKDRSILVTDEDNIFIGPNNGALGMMVAYFNSREIPYKLYRLNHEFMEYFEQHRMQSPSYALPDTFHGRDLLGVAAGMIAGGTDPKVLGDEDKDFMPIVHDYAKSIVEIPMRLGEEKTFHAFQDNTFGNLKTNISMDQATFNHLVDEQARFEVYKPGHVAIPFLRPRMKFDANHVFANIKSGGSLLYLGSTFSPTWDERFIELAVNMGSAADQLSVEHNYVSQATPLIIKRVN